MRIGNIDYISLTDLTRYKNAENPLDVINKWMSNKDSFDFYSLWEELFNENFNFAEFREFKNKEVGYNAFTMSPSKWKKELMPWELSLVGVNIVKELMLILILL